MVWKSDRIDRLYELYQRYFDRLRDDIIAVNRSMSSTNPERTAQSLLSRAEFEDVVRSPGRYPAFRRVWLQRIIEGHENEFPDLEGLPQDLTSHSVPTISTC